MVHRRDTEKQIHKNYLDSLLTSQFIVLFYFQLNDCGSCLFSEIKTWNKFSKAFDKTLCQVVGFTDTYKSNDVEQIKSLFNIRFPVVQFDNLRDKLNDYGLNSTPVVLFGDNQTQKCIYAFLPTPEKKSEDGFNEKLARFLAKDDKQLSYNTID